MKVSNEGNCCKRRNINFAYDRKSGIQLSHGFTLIELLVVISIIAVLMSIMMPALSKAKSQAQEVICKTNLHQYSIATETYSADNSDKMPDPWRSLYSKQIFAGEKNRFCRWHNPEFNLDGNANKTDSSNASYAGPFWPYLASTKASVCPVFKKLAPSRGQQHVVGISGAGTCIGDPFQPQFSYSMNSIFYGNGGNYAKPYMAVRKTGILNPSKTFVWAEENMWKLKHKDGYNLSSYVLNDNCLQPGADCFASFHKVSTQKLSQEISQNIYSGIGVSNAVLADGSVAVVAPTDTSEYKGVTR